ncbi:hypothetical protein PVAP13_9NG032600 [Panicum virgatum]|uniref:KIB1-4 beta-propeller domain-containing protein n=1 Tax=Panicum virgatum TaxID=38727 RepID=A0A8T0MAY4_PANVG|nr:hypothetical protein PVAP13_9NG032600 [Panicum virgatum]
MSSRHMNRPAASVACSSKRPAALVVCSSSRRRRKIADAAAAAAAATRDSSSWASLHEDLVSLIGWRVLAGDLRDYIRFRAVCPHWRSSTTCPRGRGIVDPRFHPRRWMLFPEGHGLYPGHGKLGGYVHFFNLSTGAFVRVRLPFFRDHCVLDSVDGILLLQRDQDTAIRLLHPFTGDIAEFPPLETLLPHVDPWLRGNKWNYLRSICAACISVGADGVVKVMMSLPGNRNFIFATSGDQQWRISSWRCGPSCVPLPFQGKFYMLHHPEDNSEPEVFQVDPPPPPPQQEDMNLGTPSLPPAKFIAKCPASTEICPPLYDLVECNSEILVMTLRALSSFLGRYSEAFPTIVADTIVLFEPIKKYLAQYHLNSDTLSAASVTPGIAFPSPSTIISHIFTCCFREYWNKGQIIFHGNWKQWRVKRKWRHGG